MILIGFGLSLLNTSRKIKADHKFPAPLLKDDLVWVYWGQNSAGVFEDQGGQGPLKKYCDSDSWDIVTVSFLYVFGGGRPFQINLANACDPDTAPNGYFPGTQLLHCPDVGADIKYCQSKGKQVLLSMGGAVGDHGFSGDADGTATAQKVHDVFGTGESDQRPFDDAVFDGYDLDIENANSGGYSAFVKEMRRLEPGVLFSAAPQCPLPDAALNTVMTEVGMDYIGVQFYNNWCSRDNQPSTCGDSKNNYCDWEDWGEKLQPNKNVRIFFGTPASGSAAGSGYRGFDGIASDVAICRKTPKLFGGIMLWDMSQGWRNQEGGKNFIERCKEVLRA